MGYQGPQPARAPLTADQMTAGDQRFGKIDGANRPLDMFKNALINGSFEHWQRGTFFSGTFGSATYGAADRWALLSNVGTMSMTRQSFIVPGVECGNSESRYYLDVNFTGSTGAAGELAQLRHHVEGVHRLSGRRAVLRGWNRSRDGSTANIAVTLVQFFGTGGAPSATVVKPLGLIPISAGFKPFSLVFDVPSMIGKVFGTNGDDYVGILLALSAGSNQAANYSNLGTQNFGVHFADLEVKELIGGFGDQFPPFERVPRDIELLRCQRYFQTLSIRGGITRLNSSDNTYFGATVPLTVKTRVTPSLSYHDGFGNNGRVNANGTGNSLPAGGGVFNDTLDGKTAVFADIIFQNSVYGWASVAVTAIAEL